MSSRGKRRSIGALVPFDGDASVRLEGVELAFTVPVVALSHEALLVRAPESAPAGSLIHLELTTGSDLVQGMGEVAGVRPSGAGHEILIQLLFVDEPSRKVLRRLVSDSRSEATSVEWAAGSAPAPEPPRTEPPPSPSPSTRPSDTAPPSRERTLPVAPAATAAPTPSASPTSPQEATASPAPAPAATEEAPQRAAGGWVLDPIDATQVAAADLEHDPAIPEDESRDLPARHRPAAEPVPVDTDLSEESVSGGFVWDDGSPASPAPTSSTTSSQSLVAAALEASARESEDVDHRFSRFDAAEGDETETSRRGARGRLLPVLFLVAAFVAAAWWTRSAWLGTGSPEPEAPSAPAAADGGGPAGEAGGGEGAQDFGAGPEDTQPGSTSEPSAEPVAPPMPAVEFVEVDGPRELLGVDVSRLAGETRVTLSLSGPIAPTSISSFGLVTPPRYVVRLVGVTGAGIFRAETPELTRVRVGLHEGAGGEPETHVVFDLAALGTSGTFTASGSSVEVRLAAGG